MSSKETRNRRDSEPVRPRAVNCEPAEPVGTVTDRLNNLLRTGGADYTLSLCPNQNYPIIAPLQFTAPRQEISTAGLPTDDSRAILTVSGPVLNGNQPNHTTAVVGSCATCNDVKLRHIQINGNRSGAGAVRGGANIEMGGPTSGQVVEFVRSFDPRSWSCLHIAEGSLRCTNALVQNNDIGPCGSDKFQQWADGISVACAKTTVRNNLVNTATDGAIVLFGSPGSSVENNTIWVETHTLLGGINMVDYLPWSGDYDGVVVRQNNIVGGLATDTPDFPGDTRGTNNASAIIKLGIAIGPRVWFGNRFLANISHGGTVMNNRFEGAFGYAIAISSAKGFTLQDNELVGNTTFIGSRGPNCSTTDPVPESRPFVIQKDNVTDSSVQSDFVDVKDGDSLNCVIPPPSGDYWPFGGYHRPNSPPYVPDSPSPAFATTHHAGLSTLAKALIGAGAGLLFAVVVTWFVRTILVRRKQSTRMPFNSRTHTSRSALI